MKQMIVTVGIFSLGVSIGVLASKTYFEKKYKEMADEEIESMKKFYGRRKLEEVPFEERVERAVTTGIIGVEDLGENHPLKGYSTVYASTAVEDAISYHDHYSKEEEKVNEAKTLSPVEEEVYEISPDDFAYDTDYDKVTLNLYTEDGVLIYEEGEEMVDESIIGSENIDDFSNTPFAQTYLRDPKNKIDYEIIKVDGSYHELIAGNV